MSEKKSTVRVDRLIEARDWALANPSEFEMDSYAVVRVDLGSNTMCGTTKCLAGYGASRQHPVLWKQGMKQAITFAINWAEGIAGLPLLGAKQKSIHDVGAEWFGLDEEQANTLFLSSNEHWLVIINKLIEEHS